MHLIDNLGPQPEALVRTYRPRMAAQYWESIGSFVRTTVMAAAPDTYEQTRRLLSFLAPFALWAWGTACLELDRVALLKPSVIDAYLQANDRDISLSARERERNALHWLCKRLNPEGTTPTRSYHPHPSSPEAPYSAREMGRLRNWASSQRLTRTSKNLRTMLALGVGAGLHPNEIIELPQANIEFTARGTTIHVTGKNSRSVPLLHEWEDYVDLHPEDDYAIKSAATNRTTKTLSDFIKASSGMELKATPQRLRVTWLVTHLNAATPLPVLLDAAGLASPFSLNRYLPYADSLDAIDADAALRQTGGHRA